MAEKKYPFKSVLNELGINREKKADKRKFVAPIPQRKPPRSPKDLNEFFREVPKEFFEKIPKRRKRPNYMRPYIDEQDV